jgi:hypothetical protein
MNEIFIFLLPLLGSWKLNRLLNERASFFNEIGMFYFNEKQYVNK